VEPQLVARGRGTRMKVSHLFMNLPVRQLEFEKCYKSQYNRTINLITEYAIIHPEIELKVYNN
jgi:DNA mismatch repair ATPase MutL